MTYLEFTQLKCGYFVKSRDSENIYEIVQEDVWGMPKLVFLAQLCETNNFKQIQISEGNYQFWDRVYV